MNDYRFDHYVWRFAEELSLNQAQTGHARTILADFESELLGEVEEQLRKEHSTLSEDLGYRLAVLDGFVDALKRGEIPR